MSFKISRDKKLRNNSFMGYVTKNRVINIKVPKDFDMGNTKHIDNTRLISLVAHEVTHYRQMISNPTRLTKPDPISLIQDEYEAYMVQVLVVRGLYDASKRPLERKIIETIKKRYGENPYSLSYDPNYRINVDSVIGSIDYIYRGKKKDKSLVVSHTLLLTDTVNSFVDDCFKDHSFQEVGVRELVKYRKAIREEAKEVINFLI